MSDQPKKRGRRAAGATDETEQQIPIVEAKAAETTTEATVADEHDVAAEAPIEVINLDGDLRRSSQTRIDSLLSALESEIRAMPASEDERESAIAEVIHLIRESLTRWPKKVIEMAVNTLKANINSDYLDADFWKGIGLVLRYQLDANADMVKRRWRGDYAVDEFGLDYELLDLAKPLLLFMYKKYWRVEAIGLENVPDSGRALLVCNHSGVLPWDGAMVGAALNFEHEAGRVLRNLHLSWFSSLPFISPLLSRLGQVQALPANAEALLERDELVGVFPEGLKGVGKLYKDRYRLARFGRGGFVKVAVKTGAPIIPVSIIGGEEIHPHLHNAKGFAKLLGFPYFPITPTFPWFGPLGLIPLPTKWTIVFGEPIDTEQYGAKGAEDPLLISQLTEQVRTTIQNTLLDKLKDRSNIFV
ncbi:lysophospholipid acyltransferase family protein [Herpetosiphon sp. NSE202]|uniref:lysophospholipid acyltransferase family protein n=1 Tax=Herpetosiphon sp. NSE202 TaxID=3351349 RepID=UPI00363ADD0C